MTEASHTDPLAPLDLDLGTRWFHDLIPDLASRAQAFRTSADAVDEDIMRLFAEQMRLAIHALHGAIATGDMDGIRRQAHSLQGMGGTAGSPEISVVGEELSRCAKRGDLSRCGELTTRLDSWQTNWTPELTPGDLPATAGNPRLSGHILIVDDELANRSFLRKLLTQSGAEVIEATTGEQALELARQTSPDLALVDVVMPGLSGYEVCRRLTADPATCHMSVIMVTARS
ncbi:MAG: response regulator, partial [bacterium]